MAQPITDYNAFFTGAKQAVAEREQLEEQEKQLAEQEKQLESNLKAKQKSVSEEISRTIKQRSDEITKSYDAETSKSQTRLKQVRAKREKAKNQGVKERIAEETEPIVKQNEELVAGMKKLFSEDHVPFFCRSRYYYAMYFTHGFREMLTFLLTIVICFLAVPCVAYFLIPERKTWYLVAIYVAVILVFGGIYVTVGNRTKLRHMDALKEGRRIRNQIRANEKKIKSTAKSIRRDKNDSVYDLQKFDDEIAQLEQDLAQTAAKKKEALNTFNTVTKTIISDEIMGNNKAALDELSEESKSVSEELKNVRKAVREKALYITDNYEAYVGKSFMTVEKLSQLEDIISSGAASNISEAVTMYRKGGTQ